MNIELTEKDGELVLSVPTGTSFKKKKEYVKKIRSMDIKIVEVDRLSLYQTKLIWALCRDYGELVGYTMEEMREVLQTYFCNKREIEYFSISPHKTNACSMTTATEFIQYIIEHSINQGFNLIVYEGRGEKRKAKSVREVVPDIRAYIIACMLNKRCCCCGSEYNIALHHSPSVATIGGYENCDGLKTGFLPLCDNCHALIHNMGDKEFFEQYHLQEVWLSENLVKALKPIYPWYFKAFKKERVENE